MDGFLLGQKVQLTGHFNEPVTLLAVRPLGSSYECRVRLTDGSLGKTVLSQEEAQTLLGMPLSPDHPNSVVDMEKLRVLVESERISLVCSYSRHFTVSLLGIRTLIRSKQSPREGSMSGFLTG